MTDSSLTIGKDNDSIWWSCLLDILESSDKGDTNDSDDTKWLYEDFHKQKYMISNKWYAKLKLSNVAVYLINNKPIMALFYTEATCSCIPHHLFQKISDQVDITRKSLWVNKASRSTIGLIGIVLLALDISNHTFVQNFIICKKLK